MVETLGVLGLMHSFSSPFPLCVKTAICIFGSYDSPLPIFVHIRTMNCVGNLFVFLRLQQG